MDLLHAGDVRVTEETPIAGDIFVMDGGNNITAMHVAKLANTLLAKGMAIAHEAYPQRLKRIHLVNIPEYAEKILVLFRSFMKEKMRNRVSNICSQLEQRLDTITLIFLVCRTPSSH